MLIYTFFLFCFVLLTVNYLLNLLFFIMIMSWICNRLFVLLLKERKFYLIFHSETQCGEFSIKISIQVTHIPFIVVKFLCELTDKRILVILFHNEHFLNIPTLPIFAHLVLEDQFSNILVLPEFIYHDGELLFFVFVRLPDPLNLFLQLLYFVAVLCFFLQPELHLY